MTPEATQPMLEAPSVSGDAATAVNRSPDGPDPWDPRRLAELGAVLRSARVDAGLALADLEPVAGSRSSLRRIEAGATRTRASRLRPWLTRLGIEPDPVLRAFADVVAPERPDGSVKWQPVVRASARKPDEPPVLTEHDQAALGAELWRIRVHAKLSRPQLAARLGCSRVHVWLVEHGHNRPSLELLAAWLRAAATLGDATALARRFPALIASLAPAPGAPRPNQPRTHGRAAARPAAKESR